MQGLERKLRGYKHCPFIRTQGANKHLLFQFQGIWCFLLALLVIRHVCLHMYDYTCSQDTHTYTLIILKHIIQYL